MPQSTPRSSSAKRDATPSHSPQAPWAETADEVLSQLQVEPASGLSRQVLKRRKQFGSNQLTEARSRGPWRILLDQFKSVVLVVLLVAAAVTISFLTLGLAKLWFVLNLRDLTTRIWDNEIVRNRWIWGAIGLCVALLLLAVYAPGLATLLKTQSPGWNGWLCVAAMSAVPVVVGQTLLTVWNAVRRARAAD